MRTVTLLAPVLAALFPFVSTAQCWELVFRVPGNPTLNDVYFVSETTGWTVGNTGIIYKTTDGGANWAVQSAPTVNDLNAVHFIDENKGWAVGDLATMLVTTNGGSTWQKDSLFTHPIKICGTFPNTSDIPIIPDYTDIFFSDNQQGWLTTAGNPVSCINPFTMNPEQITPTTYFAVTNDGGQTWTPQDTLHLYKGFSQPPYIWGIFYTDQLVIPQSTGYLSRSDGNGNNWQEVSTFTGPIYDVHFLNSATGWLAGSSLYYSDNSGNNWEPRPNPAGNVAMKSIAFTPSKSKGWMVGGGIIYSPDAGATWQEQLKPVSSVLNRVFFASEDKGWAVGEDGVILRYLSESEQPIYDVAIAETICEGEVAMVGDSAYTTAGAYPTLLHSVNGCDSLVTLTLTVLPNSVTELAEAICEGDSYPVFDEEYPTAGSYRDTLPGGAANGCDSIVVLQLTVNPTFQININAEICEGDAYTIGDSTFTLPGQYTVPLQTTEGCDSIIHLELSALEPATVDAGEDQSICESESLQLSGTFLGSASGVMWSSRGDGQFSDPASAASTYFPGDGDKFQGTALLLLTTDDPPGPCPSAVDSLRITIIQEPEAFAGEDISVCENETVQLNGGIRGGATSATWSTSGDGSFNDPQSLTAKYTPGDGDVQAGSATLTLTADSPGGVCEPAQASVTITIFNNPPAQAGHDETICSPNTELNGNAPTAPNVTGRWEPINTNAVIDDPLDPSSAVFELGQGVNQFRWILSHPQCPDYDSDEVVITFDEVSFQAVDNYFIFDPFENPAPEIRGNVLDNDLASGQYAPTELQAELVDSFDGLSLLTNGDFFYNPEELNSFSFTYQLSYRPCPELATIAEVIVNILPQQGEDNIIITPNGDGMNDKFEVPELIDNMGKYKSPSLVVFNRWGQVIYNNPNYSNDWDIRHQKTGERLPTGSYFYVLKLDEGSGEIRYGELIILR
ncbi:MAG: gliding motility-associated C-terminal domain-containing protein [Lewinellaceae bacterium]|nr:gliding motility-associated C-terminal domain-containing protein [Lewinellaceae bacterium]